jgi:hypothetical protein
MATLLLGIPLALAMRGAIADHLGASLAAEAAAVGVNWPWWQEFSAQAEGIASTLEPSILGFASVLRHLGDLLDGERPPQALVGALAVWLLGWSFLSGGMLDRYARNRSTWASGFFAACGTHFFRFLRLGVMAGLAYYLLFARLHPLLHDTLWRRLTRDLASERTGAIVAVALYAAFGLVLVGVSLVFDYARVRIVVEDRRSAIGAVVAAVRFVWRHLGRVAGLFAVNTMGFALLAAVYAAVAPGAWVDGSPLWQGLIIGQAWILARLWVKLTFYASGISLFQRELAHADYVATAIPEWPESPAAEALRGEPPSAAVP